MSASSPVRGNTTGSSEPSKLHPRTGRNTAIAMVFLVSGFAGFFFSMKFRDEKRTQNGNMHQYEHTISKRPGEYHLHESDSSITKAVKLPVYTHEAQHHARTPGWNTSSDGVAHSHHIHQPAPQREKGDGSGNVYTKKV